MLVNVRTIKGGKTATLTIHNSGWRRMSNGSYQRSKMPTKPEVPSALSSVLNRHKPGDVIAVRAQMIGGVLTLHSAKTYEAKPGEFAADSAFFVEAAEKRTYPARVTTNVTLVKYGKNSVVPLMQIRTKDDRGRAVYTTRPDLAEALAALKQGDLVEVDVGKDRGKRVIRHIAKWQGPQLGTFVALGQTEEDKVKHVTVKIYSDDGETLTLMVQQKSYDGVKYTDDYAMGRFVRKLKPNQRVAYKTRMHGEKTILWLIGPAQDKPSRFRRRLRERRQGQIRPPVRAWKLKVDV